MRKLHKLLMAALVIAPLTACDEGNDTIAPAPPAPAIGTVSGTVAVEGTGVAGITVQLAGASAASTTSGSNGAFSFANVVEGNYSVTISGISGDYAFATTSQTVTINTNGQTATADFNGSWVRTASVLVSVERADGSGVATTVTLAGDGASQSLGTNAQGAVTFGGLKKGAYTVTIPAIDGFSTTTASVTLGTGQAAQVNFVGERELLPPEVSVASISDADGSSNYAQSVDNITGAVDVQLNVRPNGNTLTSVELWLLQESTGDIYRVGRQRFATTAGPLAAGEDVAEVTFSLKPGLLYRRDGSHPSVEKLGDDGFAALAADSTRPYHPILVDGDYELHGVVTVAESEDTYNAIVDVTLNSIADLGETDINLGLRSDHAILRVETDNTDWVDPVSGEYFPNSLVHSTTGLLWHSGDVIVDAYPVMFSAPYNPNDPSIAQLSLNLTDNAANPVTILGAGAVTKAAAKFNADGSATFVVCENSAAAATLALAKSNAGGSCDALFATRSDDDIQANLSTVTKFGQPGFSTALTWFEDLFSGTADNFRLDNVSPTAAAIFVETVAGVVSKSPGGKIPHPGNVKTGTTAVPTSDFLRTASPAGANSIGWFTHADVLDALVDDAAITDADIGLPGTSATRPSLIYVAGPDNTKTTVASIIAYADTSGVIATTVKASDLPAETDNAVLVSAGSAAGSPLSDAETDYAITARNWDLFGNFVNASNYGLLGVDNLAPIFTNAAGTAAATPKDPTLYAPAAAPFVGDSIATVYNTYEATLSFPDTTDTSTDYGAIDAATVKQAGQYAGQFSDTGQGFAGIAGMLMEFWENGNGTVAGTSTWDFDGLSGSIPEPFLMNLAGSTGADGNAIVAAGTAADGYRDNRLYIYDRAGNGAIDNSASEYIADKSAPFVNVPSAPGGPFTYNTAYSWSATVGDSVDLSRGNVGFRYALGTVGITGADLTPAAVVAPQNGFVLPVANTSFAAFGSAAIVKSSTLSLSNVIPCLWQFDEGGLAAAPVLPAAAEITVWDHASRYGLVGQNSVAIATGAAAATWCGTAATPTGSYKVATDLRPALLPAAAANSWGFSLVSSKPTIKLTGATGTFVPNVDMANVDLYYLDIAGRPVLMETSASDWSLTVTDSGVGNGREYVYTFNGTLPAAKDRIDGDVLTAAATINGTVGGYFFTYTSGGTILLWDNSVN